MKFKEFQIVKLLVDEPEYNLKKGTEGTIIEVFDKPEGYMVEFVFDADKGDILSDVIFEPEKLELTSRDLDSKVASA